MRDYFETNRSVSEILAKDLMPLFIRKGIFLQDHRKGLPIRILLRQLDKENRLYLLRHVNVMRKDTNHNVQAQVPEVVNKTKTGLAANASPGKLLTQFTRPAFKC